MLRVRLGCNNPLRAVEWAKSVARAQLAPGLLVHDVIDPDAALADLVLCLPAAARQAGGLDGLGQRDVVAA